MDSDILSKYIINELKVNDDFNFEVMKLIDKCAEENNIDLKDKLISYDFMVDIHLD